MEEKRYDPYTGYEITEEEKKEQEQKGQGFSNQKSTGNSNGIALAAMILGIISVVMMITCCCTPFAIIVGIAAIVCFAVSPKNMDGKKEKRATAGLVCGIIGMVGSVILILVFVFQVLLSEDFQRTFDKEFQSNYEQYMENEDDSF